MILLTVFIFVPVKSFENPWFHKTLGALFSDSSYRSIVALLPVFAQTNCSPPPPDSQRPLQNSLFPHIRTAELRAERSNPSPYNSKFLVHSIIMGSETKRGSTQQRRAPAKARKRSHSQAQDAEASLLTSAAVSSSPQKKDDTPRTARYSHRLPTTEQRKGNGRKSGRSLIMWSRTFYFTFPHFPWASC